MGRSNGLSAQKRLRERKRAEKAELKRETRRVSKQTERGREVANRDDLEGYGVAVDPADDGGER
jgi:hypothetical protein